MESRKYLCGLESGQVEETAPDLGGWKAASGKACDNPKIVGTAFESTPKVRVSGFGGRNHIARRENNFVVEDIGTD